MGFSPCAGGRSACINQLRNFPILNWLPDIVVTSEIALSERQIRANLLLWQMRCVALRAFLNPGSCDPKSCCLRPAGGIDSTDFQECQCQTSSKLGYEIAGLGVPF
jgi:hypothetical protein